MAIVYAKCVAVPPTHLDMSFFQEVAENGLRETSLKVSRVTFSMGSATGENYLSQIYRANLEYKIDGSAQGGELSVIIKSMPSTEVTQFLDDLQVFLKEKIVYLEVLPRMEMFLSGTKRFGARMYHSIKFPVNTLVLEDLNTSNFEMACRERGLDDVHARLVMERLGRFHAISMCLAQKEPDLIRKAFSWGMLSKGVLERDHNVMFHFFNGNTAALLAAISKWQGYEAITKKIKKYTANLKESLWQAQAPQPGEIKVLNHGDLWVNNMLFQYDQQRNVQDVIFVDYQLSVWGSPGIDLNYFFYTSLQLDLLKNKRDEYVHVYHEALCDKLRLLQFPEIPTYQQILQEVKNRERYGFFANYAIFPTLTLTKEQTVDNTLDNLADADFQRRKLQLTYDTKRVQETLRYTLKRFDELGIWD